MSTNTPIATGPTHTPTQHFLYHHTLRPNHKTMALIILVKL